MGFSKVLVSGQHGSVSVSEDGGHVVLSGSVSASVGGGEAKGVVGVSGSLALTLEAKQLIDLGLDLAAAKFPGAASLIEAAKAGIDAELARL